MTSAELEGTHDAVFPPPFAPTEDRACAALDGLESPAPRSCEEVGSPGITTASQGSADFMLSVVVPVYNERDTISRVIRSLLALPLPAEVIVVDDGSTDGTRTLLTEMDRKYPELRVVFQESNQGKGAALRRGFSLARGTHLIIQDADLEYDPQNIPQLVQPFLKGDVDAVYGSRFLNAHARGSSWVHRCGNWALTAASNALTGWKLTDMETCYKVVRTDLLQQLDLRENGFGIEVELTAKLARLGARVAERPISYRARDWSQGKKISWKDGIHAFYCMWKYR